MTHSSLSPLRWQHVAALAAAALTLLPASKALAQQVTCAGGDFPCSFQIRDAKIQPVPTLFKFQSRVSQAKLPVGDGVFDEVYVNLKRGNELLCQEQFVDVRVTSSVLNLEIGRNMSCELDQVIAENHDLVFQVCIGGTENCLRPVALGTSAYAIKSSFSTLAQEAHNADIAAMSHYAGRATADRSIFVTDELGTGYFDFYTHVTAPQLYSAAEDYAPFADGGFLQWTPLGESEPTLHISAKDHATDTPRPLDRLVLFSDATDTMGRLNVRSGGAHVVGASDVTGNTTIRGQLKVDRPTGGGPDGAHVVGNSTVIGTLTVSDALTVRSGGAQVTGDSAVVGSVDVSGNASIAGFATVGGTTTSTSTLSVLSGGASIVGDSNVEGHLRVASGLTVAGDGAAIVGNVDVQGFQRISHFLTIGGPLTVQGGGAIITGDLSASGFGDFGGYLNVGGTLSVESGGAHIVGDVQGTGQLRAAGALTIEGGGAHITGTSRFEGALSSSGSIASASTVSGERVVAETYVRGAWYRDGDDRTVLSVGGDSRLHLAPGAEHAALRVGVPLELSGESVAMNNGTGALVPAMSAEEGSVLAFNAGGGFSRTDVLGNMNVSGTAQIGNVNVLGTLTVNGNPVGTAEDATNLTANKLFLRLLDDSQGGVIQNIGDQIIFNPDRQFARTQVQGEFLVNGDIRGGNGRLQVTSELELLDDQGGRAVFFSRSGSSHHAGEIETAGGLEVVGAGGERLHYLNPNGSADIAGHLHLATGSLRVYRDHGVTLQRLDGAFGTALRMSQGEDFDRLVINADEALGQVLIEGRARFSGNRVDLAGDLFADGVVGAADFRDASNLSLLQRVDDDVWLTRGGSYNSVIVDNPLQVQETLTVTGNAQINGDIAVGSSTLHDGAFVGRVGEAPRNRRFSFVRESSGSLPVYQPAELNYRGAFGSVRYSCKARGTTTMVAGTFYFSAGTNLERTAAHYALSGDTAAIGAAWDADGGDDPNDPRTLDIVMPGDGWGCSFFVEVGESE